MAVTKRKRERESKVKRALWEKGRESGSNKQNKRKRKRSETSTVVRPSDDIVAEEEEKAESKKKEKKEKKVRKGDQKDGNTSEPVGKKKRGKDVKE